MADIRKKLDADLKQAMLSRDKQLVSVLKGLKSAIQYAEVSLGAGNEISDEQAMKVLQKESKKRVEAADIYKKAGDEERAEKENDEKRTIDNYLPEQLNAEEVSKMVEEVIGDQEVVPQNMGRIISEVREKSGGRADGSLIARLVKERMGE